MAKKEWYEEIASLDEESRYGYIVELYNSLLASFRNNLNLLLVKITSYVSSFLEKYSDDSYKKLRDFMYRFANGKVFEEATKDDFDTFFDEVISSEVSITATNIREVFSNFITPEVSDTNRMDIMCLFVALISVDGVMNEEKFSLLNQNYFEEFKEVLNL